MCKNCCEQPGNLKSVPEECSPEQVKKCHGNRNSHLRQDQWQLRPLPSRRQYLPAKCKPARYLTLTAEWLLKMIEVET